MIEKALIHKIQMASYRDIPERIKGIRQSLQLSQTEFAKLMGLPGQVSVSALESGKRRNMTDIINTLTDMGFDREWLMVGTTSHRQNDRIYIETVLNELDDNQLHFVRKWIELFRNEKDKL